MSAGPGEEDLAAQHAAAFEEWAASEDAEFWERAVGDGLDDEPAEY